jgi:hypothetical protein
LRKTLYWATTGFDWGAFWGFPALGGLPFFLRKMNMLGAFCLVFMLSMTMYFGFDLVHDALEPDNLEDSEDLIEYIFNFIAYYIDRFFNLFLIFGISLYLGIKGGKITARHYSEEGYEIHTQDKALLTRAKNKWGLESL